MYEFRKVNVRNINVEEINIWIECRVLGIEELF